VAEAPDEPQTGPPDPLGGPEASATADPDVVVAADAGGTEDEAAPDGGPEATATRGGPGMVAGCLAFAVLSLALVGGTIFALVVALSGSSPGPSVVAPTTHPAGATTGHRSGSGEPTSGRGTAGSTSTTTTTTTPGGAGTSGTTTVPTAVPGVVPTTLPLLGTTPTTMPMNGTDGSASGSPSLIPQAGAACTADQVGVTVRLPDGSLITCEASGPSAQWVPISG
jgi:hypothetical protein